MHYAEAQGFFNVLQAMQRFAANPHDDAAFWQPAPLLARLAAAGQGFSAAVAAEAEGAPR
jgi:3-hydroxyacyl-CoA dehydrogenase